MHFVKHFSYALALSIGAFFVFTTSGEAQEQQSFQPRLITLYVGYSGGGGYDISARLLARHLGRHLPGNPNVVVQNRPGAGSIGLANELAGALPSDGSVLGMIGDVLHIKQVLGEPGIKFIATDYNWIGRIGNSDPVLVLRKDAPALTIEAARIYEVSIGVPGAGSATAQTLTVVNALLGTKFKLISGYPGSNDVRLAVERGEVHGSGSVLWGVSREWVHKNDLKVLYQVSFEKYSDLPDVPRLIDLARNEGERKLLGFFSSYTDVGRSILAPPQVSADRVKVLRAAFDKTVQDPKFIKDAEAQKADLAFLSGEKLQQLVADVSDLSGALLTQAKEIGSLKVE